MKAARLIVVSLIAALMLSGCGGGGGGSSTGSTSTTTGSGSTTTGSGGTTTGSGSTTSGSTGSVTVTPGSVSRMAVNGTSTSIDISIQPVNFSFSGTLYVTAVDATGVFMPSVAVVQNGSSYNLTLTTATSAPAGLDSGTLTLKLCADAACTTPQPVASVSVPFSVDELTPTSGWPGNNLTALAPWTGAPDWTTFQGNAGHTGYVPVTVDPNAFTTRWQTPAVTWASGNNYLLGNTLTTANGQFYVADSATNTLYARKELDGSTVWQYSVASLTYPSVNPPSVANGVVYMAAGQQTTTFMFALNATDGSLVFKSPMSSQWDHYLAPTVGASGVYTDGGQYGGLYAFNPTGTQMYFDGMAQTDLWTPAVDANGVYSYTGGVLKVVDPLTGATLHTITDPTFQLYLYEIDGSPVLGAPGSVFVANYANSVLNGGTTGNTLLDFNLNTNAVQWQVAGNYPSTPAYNAGVLYVANENPLRLEARSETNGSLLWSWTPPQAGDTGFASETLLTQNLVFISTNLATYAIDLTSHHTVWSYPQMGRLALSANGILYIQGSSQLTAINLK